MSGKLENVQSSCFNILLRSIDIGYKMHIILYYVCLINIRWFIDDLLLF